LWKKRELESPSFNHLDRDLWKIRASLFLRIFRNSSKNFFRPSTSTSSNPNWIVEKEMNKKILIKKLFHPKIESGFS
jgi:hypothetical protein